MLKSKAGIETETVKLPYEVSLHVFHLFVLRQWELLSDAEE